VRADAGRHAGAGELAAVERVAGVEPFYAYGVVNDNVTGDGTLFPMTRAK